MKRFRVAMYILGMLILSTMFCCSGTSSSAEPVVSSLADGRGSEVDATGTSGVDFSSLVVTFSLAMTDSTVTTAGNVTMTCTVPEGSDLEQPTIAIAASETAERAYVVTVQDAYMYQRLPCTFTITTDVTSAEGVATISAETYEFINGGAVDDGFYLDSSENWAVAPRGNFSNWTELLDLDTGILSFGSLDFDGTNMPAGQDPSNADLLGKAVTLEDGGSTLLIHMSYTSAGDGPSVSYVLTENLDAADTGKILSTGITVMDEESDVYCFVGYSPDGTFANADYAWEPCDDSTFYYLRLSFDVSTVRAEYSADGINYSEISTAIVGTWPPDDFRSDDLSYLGLSFANGDEQVGTTATIRSVTTTGISSDTQY